MTNSCLAVPGRSRRCWFSTCECCGALASAIAALSARHCHVVDGVTFFDVNEDVAISRSSIPCGGDQPRRCAGSKRLAQPPPVALRQARSTVAMRTSTRADAQLAPPVAVFPRSIHERLRATGGVRRAPRKIRAWSSSRVGKSAEAGRSRRARARRGRGGACATPNR